ncbi:MAG: hypothetical protein K6F84_04225 [Lachnospiraceae bacterium]|nr:hypothetical protein [Lachnospiraceae bacterium]
MIDWEELAETENEDELKEAKLFLFREKVKILNEKKELENSRERFLDERKRFRDEMDLLNNRLVLEKKRLREENLFFDKKMEILKDGFRQLEVDRKVFEKERDFYDRLLKERENEYLSDNSEDIAESLFKNADNPLTVRKRYKDLVKIFHPDNLCGDEEMMRLINKEYDKKREETG